MKTRSIPNTSLQPSVLCLGTDIMGSFIDRSTSFAILDAFFAAGGTFFDTAKIYADWKPGERSAAEKTLGAWVHERRLRDQVVIATKGAHPDLSTLHIQRLSPADITGDLNASLSHLKIEQIDLYWLHRDDPGRPVAEIIDTLQAQVQAGKIRYYGCSNWHAQRIREAQAYAQQLGIDGFVADQPLWNLARVEAESLSDPNYVAMNAELWAYHHISGMACMPYSSQANGFFHKLESGSRERISGNQQKMYLTAENQARAERLQVLKQQTGLSTTQVVLGYLLAQPFPTFPIVGPHNLAHLADTLSAADVMLTAEEIDYLEGKVL
jgi:aryl-alcohol dehydrogenase-like predicted oxidoreductase